MKPRRKYYAGQCQDCGWHKRVTTIYFWATGMRYVVCAECIKPYRKVILALWMRVLAIAGLGALLSAVLDVPSIELWIVGGLCVGSAAVIGLLNWK